MKKVQLLILTLILSSIVFSQSVTDTSKIKIPYTAAKQIVKDLITGDSSLALLKLSEKQLKITEEKVVLKDSIISVYKLKEKNYINQVDNEKQKIEGWQEQFGLLQKENKKLIAKNKFTKLVASIIVGSLIYLNIAK